MKKTIRTILGLILLGVVAYFLYSNIVSSSDAAIAQEIEQDLGIDAEDGNGFATQGFADLSCKEQIERLEATNEKLERAIQRYSNHKVSSRQRRLRFRGDYTQRRTDRIQANNEKIEELREKCEDTPIDKCAYVKCASGTMCVDGACAPDNNPKPGICPQISCAPPQNGCEYQNPQYDGKCQISCGTMICNGGGSDDGPRGSTTGSDTGGSEPDLCALVRCAPGTTCLKGKCVPDLILQPAPKPGIDKCALVRCSSDTYCHNGNCIPNELSVPF